MKAALGWQGTVCNCQQKLTLKRSCHWQVVVMTTKGEAVCLGVAQMNTATMASCDHGCVARIKRVIMDRGTYPKRWGLGPMALKKKQLIAEGKLYKHWRPNEATPVEYLRSLPAAVRNMLLPA